MAINEILKNEEVLSRLDAAEDKDTFCAILAQNGASQDEIDSFLETLCAIGEGELSEEELENVAGGGNPILQRYLCKWGYRIKHRKWFVKTTYDEETRKITATNRFGKKVSETYYY